MATNTNILCRMLLCSFSHSLPVLLRQIYSESYWCQTFQRCSSAGFSNLRILDISIDDYSSLEAFEALMEVTEKLVTFHCFGMYQSSLIDLPQPTLITFLVDFTNEHINLAASMNSSSFSTLKVLEIGLIVNDEFQDPLCAVWWFYCFFGAEYNWKNYPGVHS